MDTLLERDRTVVAAALGLLVVLAWLYLWRLAGAMAEMARHMGMPDMHPWSVADALLLCVMWAVMMVAMMLPSAAPMILVFAATDRRRTTARVRPLTRTGIFVLGYLVIWSLFSGIVAAAQWGLHRAALLSPGMVSTSPLLGGALLVAAGVFQWTPLKRACLLRCRSPLSFLMAEWRGGRRGAFIMGLRHGAVCIGCCWLLMGLLFVAGVMNLVWVAVIAVFVLAEKVIPRGDQLGRVAGAVLLAAGLVMIASGWRPAL